MKVALFAFNGDPMCFVHVLLNALDLAQKGHEAKIIIEGTTTKLVKDFHEDQSKPFAPLYKKACEQRLVSCVCKACANKTGSLQSAIEQGLAVCDDMSGHPGITRFLEEGYQVLTL